MKRLLLSVFGKVRSTMTTVPDNTHADIGIAVGSDEGLVVPGPAIVSEMDSTTVVLPGYAARVDSVGNLLIEPAA